MNEPLTTQVLISRIQGGDAAARDELCERYLERVYRVVRLRLGARLREKVQSCDIVQNVMMEVVKGAETFECRSEGKFLNWVNRTVENRIRDEADRWQAQKRDMKKEISIEGARSPQNSTPLDIPDAHGAPTPSLVAIRQEELVTLERAMDLLGQQSQEYHDLVIAVQLEGQTYAEISEELGKSPDAIRMKVNRAIAALTKILSDFDKGV